MQNGNAIMYNLNNDQSNDLRQALLSIGEAAKVITKLADGSNNPELLQMASEVREFVLNGETMTGQALSKA